MRIRMKIALLAIASGALAFSTTGCVVRWLGDFVGDALLLRPIP